LLCIDLILSASEAKTSVEWIPILTLTPFVLSISGCSLENCATFAMALIIKIGNRTALPLLICAS
jgi:hypothetical protein